MQRDPTADSFSFSENVDSILGFNSVQAQMLSASGNGLHFAPKWAKVFPRESHFGKDSRGKGLLRVSARDQRRSHDRLRRHWQRHRGKACPRLRRRHRVCRIECRQERRTIRDHLLVGRS